MKQTLLSASGNVIFNDKKTLFTVLIGLLTLWLGSLNTANAQSCLGPYQVYESVPSSAGSMTGWTFAAGGWDVNTSTGGTIPRTGVYYLAQIFSGTNGYYAETPTIASPQTFSFYFKRSSGTSTTTAFYDVQVSDGTNGWESLRDATILGYYGIGTYTIPSLTVPTTGGTQATTAYQLFSVTFNNATTNGRSNSNLKFRIVDARTSFVGSLFVDDISWSSKTAAQNTIFIPLLGNTSTCTQTLNTGDVYTLYDNGGANDNYQFNQDNTITFSPATGGDKIEVTFNSINTESGTDFIRLHDGATTAGTNMLTPNAFSGSTNPSPATYTSTAGSLTLRFTSDNVSSTTLAGYNITVRCISGTTCLLPSSLAFSGSGAVSHDKAFLTWTASGNASSYDIHYNTTNTTPNAGSAANGGNFGTNSATVSGLSSSTLYYFWVRSDCGGGVKSAWVGPISSTTLCAPQSIVYFENFNGLTAGAIPTCSSRSNATWGANDVNGNLFCNGIGQSYFTQGVSLTAGQLYRLTYDYSSNGNGDASMDVFFGTPTNNTAPTVSNIATSLASHTNFTAIATNIVNFTAPTTGTYYIRFLLTALSLPVTGAVNLDNVKLEIESCLAPTFTPNSPVAPAVSGAPEVTGVGDFGANVTWNVPSTGVPSNGYMYFLSTTSTAPSYNDVATGTVGSNAITLNGLSPNTRYYMWVRSDCGGQISTWSVHYVTFITTNISAPTLVKISDLTSPYNVTCGANITFTDSGGSAGAYLNNEKTGTPTFTPYSFTFTPTTPGSKLLVIFNSFSTEDEYDGLMIYSGTSNAGTLMSSGRPASSINALAQQTCRAGSWRGTISPGTILSTAADGSLTFEWWSDYLVTRPGWTASIQCVANVPTITSFTPNNNSCGTPNTVVTITGTNFTGITGISFNGAAASYVVNSTTQITATVPATATTGKIKISTSQLSVYSVTDFTVTGAPPTSTGVIVCQGTAGSSLTSSTACDISGLTSFTGSLSASSSSGPRITGASCAFTGSGYYYNATQITVSVTGSYTFQTTSSPSIDLMGAITSGPFVYGSCTTGTWLLGNDDGAGNLQPLLTVNLTAGVVYTLYTTTFNAGAVTTYTWNVSPPLGGTVSLYQSGQVEWYTASSGGSPIGTGSSFNPVGVAGSGIANTLTPGTWHFYAACSSNPTCRTDTTYVISAATPGTASSDQTICSGSVAPLTLVGNTGVVARWQYASNFGFTIGVTNIPSSASNTLSTAQMGIITGTRYFRAEVAVGSCTVYSNVVTITLNKTIWVSGAWSAGAPDATIGAEFQDDFDSNTNGNNITACSVIVNGASVTFYGGDTLTVQNAITVSSGSLTFENNASLVQVAAVTNAPGVYSGGNSGDITYTRKSTGMRLLDYTYWSSPVAPQALIDVSPLTPTNYFFDYNSSIPNWQSISANATMVPGRGYLIRAPANFNVSTPLLIHTANFTGVPNNGTISTTVVGGANQWNLLGNPYPSALNINAFIGANSAVGGTVYLWTHNTYSTGAYAASDYAVYNYVGGVGTASPNSGVNTSIPNGKIASGQGFFIKGLSSGTVTFTNAMRIAANNDQFFRMSAPSSNPVVENEKHRYWVDIANSEGAFKQVLIGYVQDATMGLDRLFDGDMVDVNTAVTLYTTVDSKKLSIQGRPLPFDVNDTIPLGYKSTISGTYNISLSQFDGLFDSQTVYLEDTLLNVIYDLKASPYTFATESGTFDNRFILRYTNNALGTNHPEFNENTVVVYKNNAGLNINSGAVAMKNVTIFDVTGREIASQKQVGTTTTVFTTLPTTQQVLLVKIEGENGGQVTKKVVY